ncbi:cyclic lactone autoinducer peptide [Lacrimispora sp.]|uniref:cyclic lactone autoinducer peptide n=1 Tax=Lacrimispora sp. TaxID=2719234 RepID=UPI003FA529CD
MVITYQKHILIKIIYEVNTMKQKMAKVISSAVLTIAKKSSNSVCDWRLYQPKVPQKLRNEK